MKIIITGATGFIGRNLAEHLHNDGHHIVATGRAIAVGDELLNKGIDFQPADILDSARLNRVFSPADLVIHCAGKVGDWGDYKEFYNANVIGTRHVIGACKHHRIKKIIFTSTPNIYFSGKNRYDISENDPLPPKPATHYSKTKRMAEIELLDLQQEGYDMIIFRPRAVYGPHDNTIVPRILKMAEKKRMPLINNGRALTDITYVENFIDAVRHSLTAPAPAWNEIYNISNGDPIRLKDWFALVLDIFGRSFKPRNIPEPAAKMMAAVMELFGALPMVRIEPSLTRFSVGYMAKSMTMAIDKAREKLDYSPRFSNSEGFRRYRQWYASQGAVKEG